MPGAERKSKHIKPFQIDDLEQAIDKALALPEILPDA
jgi:hypothetical protein